ncbi:MAG: cytochrome c oxidase subunit 3 [Acidobacteriia bacterium]|nr:cytochrome c oxidase subunit 3 [Terriglobia bacterium]
MSSPSPSVDATVIMSIAPGARRPSNAVLGTAIFIAAETMFFAALISAHTIARATAPGGLWPPANQPRLPVQQTAVNTAALLLSGVLLWVGARIADKASEVAKRCVLGAIFLGVAFVSLQGAEWIRLLRQGLTLTSSSHGGFFYLIVGTHALHVAGALVALTWAYFGMLRNSVSPAVYTASRLFWYFVVLLWPVLYLRVYL